MSIKDAELLRLLFSSDGVIRQFVKDKDHRKSYVIIEGRYFSKKAVARLLKLLLPRYRVYQDENQLLETIFQNQTTDFYIRQLLHYQGQVIPEETHQALAEAERLPVEQKEFSQNLAVEKLESQVKEETSQYLKERPIPINSQLNPQPDQTKTSPAGVTIEINTSIPPLIPLIISKVKVPSFIQDLSVNLQITVKKVITRYLSPIKWIGGITKILSDSFKTGLPTPLEPTPPPIAVKPTPVATPPVTAPTSQLPSKVKPTPLSLQQILAPVLSGLSNQTFSSFIKNIDTKTEILIRKLSSQYLSTKQWAYLISTVMGALTGYAVLGTAEGTVAGAAAGATIASVVSHEGGQILLKTGRNFAQIDDNITTAIANMPAILTSKVKLIFFASILGAIGLGFILGAIGGGSTTPTSASPVGTVDINSCQLKRSDQSTPVVTLKSSILAGYFQEAERLTTIPAPVLAGIARLENAGFIATADNSHDAFFGRNFTDLSTSCAPHFNNPAGMSSTGALGLMQIQPPLSLVPTASMNAYFPEGVEYGASFFGKTAATLTMADFCDPRKSILLAAGFTLKKLQMFYNIGDGTKWHPAWTTDKTIIEKVAKGFYGCLKYPTCELPDGTGGGPYNYGDDLLSSIQSCKTIASTTTLGFSLTCPLDPIKNKKFYITCGTAANPHPVNKCAHGVGPIYPEICDPGFYECVNQTLPDGTVINRYTDALYKAIDVAYPIGESTAQAPVSLPFINGHQVVKWQFDSKVLSGDNSCNWGWKHTYTGSYNGRILTLILTHLNEDKPITQPDSKGEIASGAVVGTITSGVGARCQLSPHLHTSIAVDGAWIEPEKEALMCAK